MFIKTILFQLNHHHKYKITSYLYILFKLTFLPNKSVTAINFFSHIYQSCRKVLSKKQDLSKKKNDKHHH